MFRITLAFFKLRKSLATRLLHTVRWLHILLLINGNLFGFRKFKLLCLFRSLRNLCFFFTLD